MPFYACSASLPAPLPLPLVVPCLNSFLGAVLVKTATFESALGFRLLLKVNITCFLKQKSKVRFQRKTSVAVPFHCKPSYIVLKEHQTLSTKNINPLSLQVPSPEISPKNSNIQQIRNSHPHCGISTSKNKIKPELYPF